MNIALIVAGGKGERINNSLPKQFIEIKSKPLFIHTLEKFDIASINEIYLVMNENYIEMARDIVNRYQINKLKEIIKGGSNRSESVFNGINYLLSTHDEKDIVLIHDGARMFVNSRIINENISLLKDYDGVATAIKATDTLIQINQNITSLNRDEIYQMQTPQSFSLNKLKEMKKYKEQNHKEYTDEISILIDMKQKIGIVEGDKFNYKITYPEDIEYANYLLK